MRCIVLLVAIVVALLVAAPARADVSPSFSYAGFSIAGGGSLAPDNDVKREWNRIEVAAGVNIVAWKVTAFYRTTDHIVNMTVAFQQASGCWCWGQWFAAFWYPTSPAHGGGTYHDQIGYRYP